MKHKPVHIPRIAVIAVLALACVSFGMFVNTICNRFLAAEPKLVIDALDYPATGFDFPPALDPQVVPAQALDNSPPLFALAYDDVVHPDEDLLLERPQPDPPRAVPFVRPGKNPAADALRPEEAKTGSPPPAEIPSVEPRSIQSPPVIPGSPPAGVQPPSRAEPIPALERPSPPETLDRSRNKYDINAGPAADEDLLFPDRLDEQQSPADVAIPAPGPVDPLPQSDQPRGPRVEVLPDPPLATPRGEPPGRAVVPRQFPGAIPAAPHSTGGKPPAVFGGTGDPHAEVFAKTLFPSAKECSTCHKAIYEEWASSSHAYAAISPMFQKFEQALNVLTKGTVGYFCLRCHAPVATTLSLPRQAAIYTTIPAGVEGVTCVACHRVIEEYGKVNGERRMEPGSVNDPVLGSGYGEGLAEVLAKKDYYKVKTGPDEKGPGSQIHERVIHFEQLSSSHFCVSCHQVAVFPGIKLEVVWEQYRASPAHKQGITCQECHMGQEPGLPQGYTTGPVAIVNEKEISADRKHSNHMFYGPGYSIAHPGTFPFHPDADDWSIPEWLQFDYRAGWGTEEFEDLIADTQLEVAFPKVWESSDDRMDAREIVDANLQKLDRKRSLRRRLMENASGITGPVFRRPPIVGRPLNFHYVVENRNIGHNLPSGSLGAQPQLWLNVALTGPDGRHLWESGYVDANGDLADLHSLEVAAGRIRRDQQLFNLQTKFLITTTKGTDREMYLPINVDFDQLPFIRPSAFPITVMNHPPFIRMEGHSLAPLGSRHATYRVPAKLMSRPGHYRLSVRMRSRAEPIYFMRYCNATPDMERSMNEWMLDFHEDYFDFYVAP